MSRKYKFHNKQGAYFISFATVYWLDIFTRQIYFNVLEESIEYCRAEKGMEVFAYCFMPSHVHLTHFTSSFLRFSGATVIFIAFCSNEYNNYFI